MPSQYYSQPLCSDWEVSPSWKHQNTCDMGQPHVLVLLQSTSWWGKKTKAENERQSSFCKLKLLKKLGLYIIHLPYLFHQSPLYKSAVLWIKSIQVKIKLAHYNPQKIIQITDLSVMWIVMTITNTTMRRNLLNLYALVSISKNLRFTVY